MSSRDQSCSIVTSLLSALQCAFEEPEDPLFGVIVRSPGKPSGDESNVAAVRAELQCQHRTALRHVLYAVENVSWKEWIIRGGQKEGGHPNAVEKREAAGSTVVVTRISEAVNRRGHGVVELVDRPRQLQLPVVEQIRIARELRRGLAPQRSNEVAIVDSSEPSRDVS